MDKLYRIKEVENITTLKRAAIYARVKAGTFPAPIKDSKTTAFWKETDLQAWIDSLPRATDKEIQEEFEVK